MGADRITLVTDVKRRFVKSARFEVRQCDSPTGVSAFENAQVSWPQHSNGVNINENESSGTQYYGISVRLDDAFPSIPRGSWAIAFELHGPDVYSTNPAFQLTAYNPDLNTQTWTVGLRGGDIENVPITIYPLSNGLLNKGYWTDFILKIKYVKDNTGNLEMWRRDEGSPDFVKVLTVQNIATLQYKSSQGQTIGDHYWKTGLYRRDDITTAILWIDGFVRGSTYESVLNTFQGIKSSPTPTTTVGGDPGDANGDNLVDGRDYIVWLLHYGQNVSGISNGDFNTNNTVDGLDYVIWLNNYGR